MSKKKSEPIDPESSTQSYTPEAPDTPAAPAPMTRARAQQLLSQGGLHPSTIEAQKALQVAKDAYERALANIDGQYLKQLDLSPQADEAAAVRALF